jgi:hypothetical protein
VWGCPWLVMRSEGTEYAPEHLPGFCSHMLGCRRNWCGLLQVQQQWKYLGLPVAGDEEQMEASLCSGVL